MTQKVQDIGDLKGCLVQDIDYPVIFFGILISSFIYNDKGGIRWNKNYAKKL